MRVKAAAAVAAILLIACTGSTSPSPPTASPGAGVAATKAADLRVRLDLLLGEHVLLIGKESAAAAYVTDEYPGYLGLLAANGAELQDVMRLAFGNTAAGELGALWAEQNNGLVEYAVGLVTHKQSLADASAAALNATFVPQYAKLISSLTRLPSDQLAALVSQQVSATETAIGDAARQSFSQMYADLHNAYTLTTRLGDTLAPRIAQLFPDKFPGDPTLSAVDTRVRVSSLLQEHAYLTTMATDAVARGRSTEAPAVNLALGGSSTVLGTAFVQLLGSSAGTQAEQLWWDTRVSDLLHYAAGTGTKASVVQDFVARFAALAGIDQKLVAGELDATIVVVDDQRSRAFDRLAADDRAAATSMQPIADAMSAAGSVQG
ncbi:MAG TPA: hypothetical protein VEW68_09575 [Patescibacteria group bacterium]|nr:hypothetical protein [Patescibacteria group bacterium]